MPPSPGERGPARRRAVFYNRAMALDRDLGVAVLAAWGRDRPDPVRGWDMLAATGARGLRLLGESSVLRELLLTERNPLALEVLRTNSTGHAGAHVEDWNAQQSPAGAPFGYVDLDPFGTPVPFLDTALAATEPGGLLALTATDMPVLAGVQQAACRARYGAVPVRGRLGSESGLRILLGFTARRAQVRGFGVHPLLAYVLDHHVRIYLELTSEIPPDSVEPVPSARCTSPPLPPGGPYGPMWVGPLFDRGFVGGLTVPTGAERPRELETLLARFRGESEVDVPFYYEPNRLAHATAVHEPPGLAAIFRELTQGGYRAARCHVQASAFRTDAPYAELEGIVRRLAGAD